MASQAENVRLRDSDLFSETNLIRVLVDIPSEGLDSLNRSSGGRRRQGKPEAQATVREGDHVYTNVSVRLKGFSTFRNIDSFPSLTLDFNRYVPKQKFHGLTKISLNNSLQDPSRLHEKLSRELFAAAKIPVPRSDFALLTLNGRDLGLYVLAEGFTKKFLEQHFTRGDGVLYEGGILRDIDSPLQIGAGQFTNDDARIQRLISSSQEPDPVKRLRHLDQILDLDRFLTLTAMETILCHSDSYSMNRNNYRLYDDPISGKFVFMPHGMDRVLGAHRSRLDLNIVPPALGMVARAVLSTKEGRARYVDRASELYTNLFVPEILCRRVREIDARIIDAKTNMVFTPREYEGQMSRGPSDDADNLCQRISARAINLSSQFRDKGSLLMPPPEPEFDSNGVAPFRIWQPKQIPEEPEVLCVPPSSGESAWRLTLPEKSEGVILFTRMTLPAGNYRLSGHIRSWDNSRTNAIRAVIFRSNSSIRYAVEEHHLNPQGASLSFHIVAPRVTDEVELACEIKSSARELWFDPGSFHITKLLPPLKE